MLSSHLCLGLPSGLLPSGMIMYCRYKSTVAQLTLSLCNFC
jgi:hypothetical protein